MTWKAMHHMQPSQWMVLNSALMPALSQDVTAFTVPSEKLFRLMWQSLMNWFIPWDGWGFWLSFHLASTNESMPIMKRPRAGLCAF